MEWSRIKTLFIYLFAVINIVLILFYINIERKNNAQRYEESKAVIESMNNDNIEVEKPIMQREKLPLLRVAVKDLDARNKVVDKNSTNESSVNTSLLLNFSEPLTNVNGANYKDDLYNYIKLIGRDEYVFTEYDITNGVIKYTQRLEGLDVYDNSSAIIEFKVDSNGDVKSLKQTAFDVVNKEKEETLVSYSQAVQKLYHENMIETNSKVSVDMGYYSYIPNTEEQVLTPVWKVRVDVQGKERIHYVDAINLKIIEK